MHALAQSFTTMEARGGLASSNTFIRKKVILVRRSIVDLRSCSFSGDAEGKLFCSITKNLNKKLFFFSKMLTLYVDRSILSEL